MAENIKKRGRPIGSVKKHSSNGALNIVKFEKQVQGAPIVKQSGMGWVNWGLKNLYPIDLINLYNTSPTHRACIDFSTNAIIGNGIDYEAMKLKDADVGTPNYYQGWDEFIRCLAFDYCLYGTFAFQIIKNRGGNTYSYFHQPVETVRVGEADEDGIFTHAYISKDWSATGKFPPVEIPVFGFQEDETIEYGKPYLFYFRNYSPINYYYGSPVYSAALQAIQTEVEYVNYDLKHITNGFASTGMLTLPTVESDEERQAVLDNIQRMFTGSENANAVMVAFRSNIEDKPAEFTSFQQNTNVNIYSEANERTINRIMAGHRITSKALIGYPVDDTGFSDSGKYLESAYALYNINVADNNRRAILSAINNAFKLNGIDTEIILKPLKYIVEDTQTTKQENTESETNDATPVNEENATEREANT